jgi:hypothetical protein
MTGRLTEQTRSGLLPVASMMAPYDHTIRIGGAGKASRHLAEAFGRRRFNRIEYLPGLDGPPESTAS